MVPDLSRGRGTDGGADRAAELRARIRQLVEEYHRHAFAPRAFRPGQDPVPVAGKVFDHRELVNLVESALDFRLTADRFSRAFEAALAGVTGLRHVLLVNSGSSANLLAVGALTSPLLGPRRLRPGDEVVTVAAGFPTTVNPILQSGLTPVFVDVDIPTYNVAVDRLEAAIGERTRAVILAHTLGNPFDLGRVMELVRRHGLFLIEDMCDALGSRYQGRLVGTFGDLATLSFYPAHHITTGEGGAVLTDSTRLGRAVRSLRDWGRDCWCEPGVDDTCGRRFDWRFPALPAGYDHKYVYSHIGYNLKLTEMQAAVGLAQVEKLDHFIERRRRNFARLGEGLRPYLDELWLPEATPGSEPSWFGFPITVRPGARFGRNELVRHLESRGVATRLLFGGNLTRQPAYQGVRFRQADDLANTDLVMTSTFWVGVHPGLDEARLDYMLEAFREFLGA